MPEILQRIWNDLVRMDFTDPETILVYVVTIILAIAIIRAL